MGDRILFTSCGSGQLGDAEGWRRDPSRALELAHPEDRDRVARELAAARGAGHSVRSEYRLEDEAGAIRWVEHQLRPLSVEGADPLWMVTLRDITSRKQVENELRSLVYLDELTGLYNRRAFFKLAAQQLSLAHRTGRGAVLLYLDVDSLREINQTRGRSAGDTVLLSVRSLLRQTFRDSDLLARPGDDEFAVWAVETDGDQGDMLRRRLLSKLEEANASSACEVPFRLSIGTVFCRPGEQTSVPELLLRADAEMYDRKRARR